MIVRRTSIPDVAIVEPRVFGDARGFFFESFNRRQLEAALGRTLEFVQDNHSLSAGGVLRGLHYQLPNPQAKLVRAVRGEVLSAENRRQLFIPEGFAHGFLVLSDEAEVHYKTTEYWHPEHERCIRWDDADLGIAWPARGAPPTVSAKDASGTSFRDAALFEPPGATT